MSWFLPNEFTIVVDDAKGHGNANNGRTKTSRRSKECRGGATSVNRLNRRTTQKKTGSRHSSVIRSRPLGCRPMEKSVSGLALLKRDNEPMNPPQRHRKTHGSSHRRCSSDSFLLTGKPAYDFHNVSSKDNKGNCSSSSTQQQVFFCRWQNSMDGVLGCSPRLPRRDDPLTIGNYQDEESKCSSPPNIHSDEQDLLMENIFDFPPERPKRSVTPERSIIKQETPLRIENHQDKPTNCSSLAREKNSACDMMLAKIFDFSPEGPKRSVSPERSFHKGEVPMDSGDHQEADSKCSSSIQGVHNDGQESLISKILDFSPEQTREHPVPNCIGSTRKRHGSRHKRCSSDGFIAGSLVNSYHHVSTTTKRNRLSNRLSNSTHFSLVDGTDDCAAIIEEHQEEE